MLKSANILSLSRNDSRAWHAKWTRDLIVSKNPSQQYLRHECLDITGIPVFPLDNPNKLGAELCYALGVDLEANEISVAHRLPPRKKVKERIMVEFVRLLRRKM